MKLFIPKVCRNICTILSLFTRDVILRTNKSFTYLFSCFIKSLALSKTDQKMLSPAIFLIHFCSFIQKISLLIYKNIFSCLQNKNFYTSKYLTFFFILFCMQEHDHLFTTQNLSVPLKFISATASPNYSNKVPKFSTQNFLSFGALPFQMRPPRQNQK